MLEPTGDQSGVKAVETPEIDSAPTAPKGDSKPKATKPEKAKEISGSGTSFKKDKDGERIYEAEPDCYNGARRDVYSWSQQILELDIRVQVGIISFSFIAQIPEHVKSARELTVKIDKKHVLVKEKNSSNPIIDLNLFKEIKTETSTWSFESQEHMVRDLV